MTKPALIPQPADAGSRTAGAKIVIGNWKILHHGLWHRLPPRPHPADYRPAEQIEMFRAGSLGKKPRRQP
jgi:hypothetical protein